MATVEKGLILRRDLNNWDGITKTATRPDSSGGTITGVTIGDAVDVLQVYGSGTDYTLATMNTAKSAVGSTNVSFIFATGTWTVTDDITIPANITVLVPAGCVFNVSAGKTLTFSGFVHRENDTWTSGSGTVTTTKGSYGLVSDATAAGTGDALIGVKRTAAGAVATTLHAWMEWQTFNVLDFMTDAQRTSVLAKDEVEDVTTPIQNAIDALTTGKRLWFPAGTYKITSGLDVFGFTGICLDGEGMGTTIKWDAGADDATDHIIKWKWTKYSTLSNMILTGAAGTAEPGFGVYITSEGTGGSNTTSQNDFRNVAIQYCSVAGVQLGNSAADVDVNLDINTFDKCGMRYCGVGFVGTNANTNNTHLRNCTISFNTSYGVKLLNRIRGICFDNLQMNGNTNAHYYIENTVQNDVQILNHTIELATSGANLHPFIITAATSGGVDGKSRIYIESCNTTMDTTGVNIMEFNHTGMVTMVNCNFAGSADPPSGTDGLIQWIDTNATVGGHRLLITKNVHLYQGAQFNIETSTGAAGAIRWLNYGSGYSTSSTTNTPTLESYNYGVDEYRETGTEVTIAGVTHDNIGYVSQATRKFTITEDAWIAAATTETKDVLTFPAGTKITGCICDTTEAFAGLAGTIQLQVGITSGSEDQLILAHDVKTATVTKGAADADLGAGLASATSAQGGYIPNFASAIQIRVKLTSGTGNIGNGSTTNLTAGIVTVYVTTEQFHP